MEINRYSAVTAISLMLISGCGDQEPALTPEAAAAVALCDQSAAHPDDPKKGRKINGIKDDDLDIPTAIKNCTAAVDLAPDLPRMQFQLARAYLAGNRVEEAIELLNDASTAGHGGAIAYLGDIMLYGLAGFESDPELAKSLYQQASKAGFKPAAQLADDIVADAKQDPKQAAEIKAQIAALKYKNPEFIQAFMEARRPKTDINYGKMLYFGLSVLSGIGEHCPELVKDASDEQWKVNDALIFATGYFGTIMLKDQVEKGALDEFLQGGVDDGYALALKNGCDAVQSRNAVQAASSYYTLR